ALRMRKRKPEESQTKNNWRSVRTTLFYIVHMVSPRPKESSLLSRSSPTYGTYKSKNDQRAVRIEGRTKQESKINPGCSGRSKEHCSASGPPLWSFYGRQALRTVPGQIASGVRVATELSIGKEGITVKLAEARGESHGGGKLSS